MSTQFQLLLLPDELIALIIEHVDDLKTLRSLTRTCHRVRGIAEGKLYRTHLIRSRDTTRNLRRALASRPERAQAIRKMECPLKSTETQDYESLEHILTAATGLRDFMYESPACNTDDFEDLEEWDRMARHLFSPFDKAVSPLGRSVQARPLQQVREVTLHLNGANSPYWTLGGRSLSLFLHPTIQKLHISCMNIPDDLTEEIPENMTDRTPLKDLVLEECNICVEGLRALLSLPSALESLYLGENCHNTQHFQNPIPPGSNFLFFLQPKKSLEALAQQKHSLQSLTYVTPVNDRYGNIPPRASASAGVVPVYGGFSQFLCLEQVTLVGHCPAFERCIMSMNSPPNLKYLTHKAQSPWMGPQIQLAAEEVNPISMIPFLRAPSACIPKGLKQLDVVHQDLRGVSIANFTKLHNKITFIKDIRKTASEAGVSLRIFATQGDGALRYYPPYLYGESEPMEILVSDSGNPSYRLTDEETMQLSGTAL